MSSRMSRRLSYAAILSTSLSGLAFASQAHATSRAVAADSPLTVDNGDGQIETVGGATAAAPDRAAHLSWSPDGSKVVYEQYGYPNNVVVANADGSDRKVVGFSAGNAFQDHPIFAYDGELIVFPWTQADGSRTLYGTWSNGSARDANGMPVQWKLPGENTPFDAMDEDPDYGGGVIAFERINLGGGGSAIYVRSAAGNFVPYRVAANGTLPTVSPDGRTVAFVAPDAHNQPQIWTVPTAPPTGGTPATPVQQTFLTNSSIFDATFSPDGTKIAFTDEETSTNGVRTVSLNTDPAATANPETTLPTHLTFTDGTTVAYRTEYRKPIVSLAGADRISTAVATSQYLWRTNGDVADSSRSQAKVAVLSRSDTYADALGGAALAAHKGGPLLLTPSGSLDASVLHELQRVLPRGADVYVLGGTGALSPAVESTLASAGFTPIRISGANRYQTSVAVAKAAVNGTPDNILIATGQNFPDALSAGAAAASDPDSVVVLSKDGVMPEETGSYLRSFHTNFGPGSTIGLWTVGGQARTAVDDFSDDTWYRYPEAGATRFDTSLMLAHDFFPYMSNVGFATAYNFPDSLAGGALIGELDGPLLLVDPASGLTPGEQAFLNDNRAELYGAYLFGGQVAGSAAVQREVQANVLGPDGPVPTPTATGAATPSITHPGGGASGASPTAANPAVGRAGAESARIKPSLPNS